MLMVGTRRLTESKNSSLQTYQLHIGELVIALDVSRSIITSWHICSALSDTKYVRRHLDDEGDYSDSAQELTPPLKVPLTATPTIRLIYVSSLTRLLKTKEQW